jgi:hypothetical protein
MTLEECAHQIGLVRDDYLARLAVAEARCREVKRRWAEICGERETRIAALEQENARLREALHIIRITGPEREAGLARAALAGAPDAPDAQEGGDG